MFVIAGHEGARGAQADRGVGAAHRAARRPGRGRQARRAALRDRLAGQEGRRGGQVRHPQSVPRKVEPAVFSHHPSRSLSPILVQWSHRL